MGTYQICARIKHSKMIQKFWRRKNHYSDCNKDGHQRATCKILLDQKAPMKEPIDEYVQQVN